MYKEKCLIGRLPFDASGSPNYGLGYTLDTATKKFDIAFIPTDAITLAKVNFRTNSIVGSPTCTVRVETDSSGRPSGTLAWANATATAHAVTSGWQTEIGLTATGVISPGTLYHLVITNDAGTPASNNFTVTDQNGTTPGAGTSAFDYFSYEFGITASFDGASWSNRFAGTFMLVSNDVTPVRIGQPVDTQGLQTMSSTINYGVKFTAPISGNAHGCIFSALPNGATGVTAKLYDSVDTLLATATLPAGVQSIRGNSYGSQYLPFDSGAVSITGGSVYRLVFLDSTSSVRFPFITAPTTPDYRQILPIMQDWQWTQGSPGSWTDTLGKMPATGLVMSTIAATQPGSL